jgi:hypothetical protein
MKPATLPPGPPAGLFPDRAAAELPHESTDDLPVPPAVPVAGGRPEDAGIPEDLGLPPVAMEHMPTLADEEELPEPDILDIV